MEKMEGLIYKHYKERYYVSEYIAVPITEELAGTIPVGEVLHHEGTHHMTVYNIGGVYYIGAKVAKVVYRLMGDEVVGRKFAREVRDFTGRVSLPVMYNGKKCSRFVKRFALYKGEIDERTVLNGEIQED